MANDSSDDDSFFAPSRTAPARPPSSRPASPTAAAAAARPHCRQDPRLVARVVELWGDMQENGRNPDYLTHIELLRAFGKGGQLKQCQLIFEQMCGKVTLLPEQRAFDSMYELCVMNGACTRARSNGAPTSKPNRT